MLKNPAVLAEENPDPEKEETASPEYGEKGPFSNEPPVEWDVSTHALFAVALDDAKKSFPRQVRSVVNGAPVEGGKASASTDPNQSDRVVANVDLADAGTVEDAVAAAKMAFRHGPQHLHGKEPTIYSKRRSNCATHATIQPHFSSTRAARTGTKPRLISAKQSISWNSTDEK
jgi:hypothetical protein